MGDTPIGRDWPGTAQSAGEDAAAAAGAASERVHDAAADLKGSATDHLADAQAGIQSLKDTASTLATDLKSQANAHLEDAKSVISTMADEARNRIADIIEQQKSFGADKLSGISRAAHGAASDLDEQNPNVARLVRGAAGSVDRIAGDLRATNLNDVVSTVSNFARKQPVAFLAGSLLAGFVLARFIKSEPDRDIHGDVT